VVGKSERAIFDFTALLEASGLLDHHERNPDHCAACVEANFSRYVAASAAHFIVFAQRARDYFEARAIGAQQIA